MTGVYEHISLMVILLENYINSGCSFATALFVSLKSQ